MLCCVMTYHRLITYFEECTETIVFRQGGIGCSSTDYNLQTTSILFENSVLPTRFAKGVERMSLLPARHAPVYSPMLPLSAQLTQ